MHVIMPIAGHGQRFRDAGYVDQPKPLIPVAGRAMFDRARDPLPSDWTVYPVCQQHSPFAQYANAVTIPGPTQGGAMTVLAAAVGLPPADPVAVMNADQTFTSDLAALQDRALTEDWDGYMLTFPSTEHRWSYAETDADGWVRRVVEKQPISPHATVGFYWWRRAGDLVASIARMVSADARTNGEFYLAPAFNYMLEGSQVKAVAVDGFHSFGTPEDVQAFEATHRVEA
jgi:NDP-sugar pyrophosphorylase family protein